MNKIPLYSLAIILYSCSCIYHYIHWIIKFFEFSLCRTESTTVLHIPSRDGESKSKPGISQLALCVCMTVYSIIPTNPLMHTLSINIIAGIVCSFVSVFQVLLQDVVCLIYQPWDNVTNIHELDDWDYFSLRELI